MIIDRDLGQSGVPSVDHIDQMLACVVAVGRLPSPSRAEELAKRVATMLTADGVTIERARPTGLFARLAAVGVTPVDNEEGRRVTAVPVGTAAIVEQAAEGIGVKLTSVWADKGRPTVLRLWRQRPFSCGESAAVALLHPHVGPMLLTSPPVVPSGVTGDVLGMLLDGLPEKEIAYRLNRSVNTVHAHVKRVYQLFGVNSRAQLIIHCRN